MLDNTPNINPQLSVVLASHNRKDKTLACIAAVTAQARSCPSIGESFQIVLVDDGSTDGSADAVSAAFPFVEIIRADGSLYWCRAMHAGQRLASARGCRYLLWINDDVALLDDSLGRAVEWGERLSAAEGKPCVVVGSLCHPESGATTYGGMIRSKWWQRTNLSIVTPGTEPTRVSSMNGNFVLIPSEIYSAVGNLDPSFEHAMGDMDYGLRVVDAGFPIWVLPGHVGYCPRNSIRGTFSDVTLPFSARWKHILSAKGLPVRSWLTFTRRHAGPFWPFYWAWPYVRVILSATILRLSPIAQRAGQRDSK